MKVKISSRKCRRTLAVLVCFTVIAGFLGLGRSSVRADEPKTIRVGYDVNANFIQENNGEYSGYGVEYLKKIAEYTGWKYEFVEYHSDFVIAGHDVHGDMGFHSMVMAFEVDKIHNHVL